MHSHEVEPGMRLARDIHDPNGNLLIRAGTVITQRHLKAFKSWGILEVSIESNTDTQCEPLRDAVAVSKIRALLDSQFSLSNLGHPVVKAIHDLCLDRATRQT